MGEPTITGFLEGPTSWFQSLNIVSLLLNVCHSPCITKIKLELEGKYDQEKFHEGYLDDEFDQNYRYRYITQWSLRVPAHMVPSSFVSTREDETIDQSSGDAPGTSSADPERSKPNVASCSGPLGSYRCVPLPESDEFPTILNLSPPSEHDTTTVDRSSERDYYKHAILEGYLLPNAYHPHLPRVHVVISSLRNVCLDPTRSNGRGFWIASTPSPHASYYWLQEPSPQQQPLLLKRRAELGVFSNLLDCGRRIRDWQEKSPAQVHEEYTQQFGSEPFSLELLRAFSVPIRRHLLQVVSPVRSPFFQDLLGNVPLLPDEDMTRLCLEAEARSEQHPWGGRLNAIPGQRDPGPCELEKKLQQDLRNDTRAPGPSKRLAGSPTVNSLKRPLPQESNVDWVALGAKLLRRTQQYADSRQPRSRQREQN